MPFYNFFWIFEFFISFAMFAIVPIMIFVVFTTMIIRSVKAAKRASSAITSTLNTVGDISEIINENDAEIRETPKSVSAMTSVYLPILQKDFPELNWYEFKNNAVNELKKHLSLTYDSFTVHRTEMYRYAKDKGSCTVIFQSAVEYIENGLKNQTRYNTHMVYIQDSEIVGDGSSYSTTCPNCGAPITSLGTMQCEYCDSIITPVNVKVWKFLKAEEIK